MLAIYRCYNFSSELLPLSTGFSVTKVAFPACTREGEREGQKGENERRFLYEINANDMQGYKMLA